MRVDGAGLLILIKYKSSTLVLVSLQAALIKAIHVVMGRNGKHLGFVNFKIWLSVVEPIKSHCPCCPKNNNAFISYHKLGKLGLDKSAINPHYKKTNSDLS